MNPNVEFNELFKRSGWNQARTARELELTTADVSRYVNAIHPPDKQTLRLFRILLGGEGGGEAAQLRAAVPERSVPVHELRRLRAKMGKAMDLLRDLEAGLDALAGAGQGHSHAQGADRADAGETNYGATGRAGSKSASLADKLLASVQEALPSPPSRHRKG